ncbi:hypothetical protein NDU88_005663 [Pleurodeles waltl]|uniref:Uncharacterized protein n=1 Tax=Pleurodeles waltl TaxID=8319 RepID=A0AAV7NVW3_PLEWA|nr:hypothetical protein NDU88_005663 [Pleurodeles waltl]
MVVKSCCKEHSYNVTKVKGGPSGRGERVPKTYQSKGLPGISTYGPSPSRSNGAMSKRWGFKGTVGANWHIVNSLMRRSQSRSFTAAAKQRGSGWGLAESRAIHGMTQRILPHLRQPGDVVPSCRGSSVCMVAWATKVDVRSHCETAESHAPCT